MLVTLAFAASTASATNLRVVEYNLDSQDMGNNNNIVGSSAGIPGVIEAIGQHHIGSVAQPVDVLALTECLTPPAGSNISATLPDLVNALNSFYGAGTYAYDPTPDPTYSYTDGPSGLIYDTKTVSVLSVTSLANGSTGAPRSPMRYELEPKGYAAYSDFYLYVSHYAAGSTAADETRRNAEATEIRANSDALGPNAHIIYTGDMNLAAASAEPAYKTLVSPGNGRAYDPTAAGYISTWASSDTSDAYLYSHSTTSLNERLDLQLVSKATLTQPGLQLATDTSDPYDAKNFPSSKYHYAYEIFGNDGSTPVDSASNLATNTAFADVTNPSVVANDLMAPSGSDHLPVVADYTIVTPEPACAGAFFALLLPTIRRKARKMK